MKLIVIAMILFLIVYFLINILLAHLLIVMLAAICVVHAHRLISRCLEILRARGQDIAEEDAAVGE